MHAGTAAPAAGAAEVRHELPPERAPGHADFHLLDDSPAIDQGSPDLAPSFDFDGNPRPQGLGFDIGAFELGGPLFADGFESGDTSAWSAAVP